MNHVNRSCLVGLFLAIAALVVPLKPANAHPHVFIDGSVDFLLDDHGSLTGLSVTWRYDPFETLYVLTSIGIVPTSDGTLSPKDKAQLIKNESEWPEGFTGASHLSIDGLPFPLSGPLDLTADLEDGRLVVQFRRDLKAPTPISQRSVEVAFYEGTYYYAFSVATDPQVAGASDDCTIDVNPFDGTAQDEALQVVLAKLGREDTPEDTNVGALFADRILLQCA